MAERVNRDAVKASYWQFNPEPEPWMEAYDPADGGIEVEAMPSAVSVIRNDEEHVLLSVRGKPGKRYEKTDSAWIELEDVEALRLIKRLADALSRDFPYQPTNRGTAT